MLAALLSLGNSPLRGGGRGQLEWSHGRGDPVQSWFVEFIAQDVAQWPDTQTYRVAFVG